MKLTELVGGLRVRGWSGPGVTLDGASPGAAASLEVTGVADDSRAVRPGDLFVAISGTAVDGRRFVDDAVTRGAVAVVVADAGAALDIAARVPTVHVTDGRYAAGELASAFHRRPSRALRLVGITGTNGKTTTTYLLEAIAAEAGLGAGVIGTTGHRVAGRLLPAATTTPGPVELQSLLAAMVDAGVGLCAAEVSSHALHQERVAGCDFSAALFTNLTRDHLDYHGTMDAYFAAKRELFTRWLPRSVAPFPRVAAINVDDPYGARLAAELGAGVMRFSALEGPAASDAEVRPRSLTIGSSGVALRLQTPAGEVAFRSPLTGAYNVSNLCGAVAVAVGLSLDPAAIARALGACRGAPGRLERVPLPPALDVDLFVDYAHTPDALERVLEAARAFSRGRVLVVFGCGGDRDRTKRAPMGEVAARGADVTIVTSDNPRTERPEDIVAEIEPGVRRGGAVVASGESLRAGRGVYAVEIERRAAIAVALGAARPGDTVIVAGKGHEDYQIVGTQKRPFDDRHVAAEEAARLAGGASATATPAHGRTP